MAWLKMADSDDWIYRHRIMRRLVLVWAVWLITLTCLIYFDKMGGISNADAAVITGIIGILSAVIGFQKRDK